MATPGRCHPRATYVGCRSSRRVRQPQCNRFREPGERWVPILVATFRGWAEPASTVVARDNLKSFHDFCHIGRALLTRRSCHSAPKHNYCQKFLLVITVHGPNQGGHVVVHMALAPDAIVAPMTALPSSNSVLCPLTSTVFGSTSPKILDKLFGDVLDSERGLGHR